MVLEFFNNFISSVIIFALQTVSALGYEGIFLLMAAESAVMPVPSEVVMPFAGYLSSQGRFDFWIVVFVASVANLVGSIIAYLVGKNIGREVILKYGKYILLKEDHVVLAENWFKKHGDKTIFISRLLPIIRTVMPLVAGIAKMNFTKFAMYTFIGSIPWNFGLTYIGAWLGQNWNLFESYAKWFDIAVVVGIAGFVAWFVLNRKKLAKAGPGKIKIFGLF